MQGAEQLECEPGTCRVNLEGEVPFSTQRFIANQKHHDTHHLLYRLEPRSSLKRPIHLGDSLSLLPMRKYCWSNWGL